MDGGRFTGRNFPVGLETSKVIDSNNIAGSMGHPQPVQPPPIVIPLHDLPAVEWIAPPLTGFAKIIRRHPCDDRWLPASFQLKEVLVRPDVRAVMGDKYRQ